MPAPIILWNNLRSFPRLYQVNCLLHAPRVEVELVRRWPKQLGSEGLKWGRAVRGALRLLAGVVVSNEEAVAG